MFERPSRLALVTLLLAGACVDRPESGKPRPKRPPAASAAPVVPAIQQPVPARSAELRDVTGPELLAEVRRSGRKGVLVNVWASWCAPCRRELPMFQNLAVNLEAQGIGVWFVSVDDAADKPVALQILKESGIAPPTFYAAGELEPFKRSLNPRWPGMIPATFMFDASGKLRYFWGGPVFEEEIFPVVEGFLAGRPIDGEADFTLSPGKVLDSNADPSN